MANLKIMEKHSPSNRSENSNSLAHIKYLVGTPLKLELKSLIDGIHKRKIQLSQVQLNGSTFYYSKSHSWMLTRCEIGKVDYALSAYQKVQTLKDCNVKLKGFVCAGIAGSLDPRLNIGDVVIGERTIEHDFKSIFLNHRPPEFPNSQVLSDIFVKTQKTARAFALLKGSIASGDEDVLDTKRALKLRQSTLAQAVAWEGAGGARACIKLGLPYLEVRAISDHCQNINSADFKNNITLALDSIAQILIELEL